MRLEIRRLSSYQEFTMTFVNRERELSFLEQRCASDQAELVVLYGRRRVGKTELLRKFCAGKKHLFFVADLGTEESQLADFTRQIGEYLAGDPGLLAPFASHGRLHSTS